MMLNRHIHPYLDNKTGFEFRYIPVGNGYSVDVRIDKSLPDDYQRRVKETLRLYKIQEIYNAAAAIREIEVDELRKIVAENFARFRNPEK